MGFNKIYKALQEIFPEIDSRVLRAVALENRNDADAAVDVVLTKVIPHVNARSRSSNSPSPSRISVQSPKGSALAADGTHSQQNAILENTACSDEAQHGQFFDAECDHDQLFDDVNGGICQMSAESRMGDLLIRKYDHSRVPVSANSHVALSSSVDDSETHFDHEKLLGPECEEELICDDSQEKYIELGIAQNPGILSSSLERGNSDGLHSHLVEDNQSDICSDGIESEVQNSEGRIEKSHCDSLTLSSFEGNSVHFVARTEVLNSDLVKEPCAPKRSSGYMDSTNILVDVEYGSTLSVSLSRPAQICCTDVLEDDIAVERNNKKTLFTALQSVISLMREAEAEESMAAHAKEEAAKGGLDILQRVEDLKEMLQHAKEANAMHAGEVNGEKAILATEFKELQSRLISLSDERDRSLQILNEMRQSLEVRLVAAKKEKEAAEREKIEKEATAQKALADQELIMDSIVQEASILKQQAEENSKLREFLVDRGHVVDMLQGEISVICQDVMLLKKEFDECLPLSKLLASGQTSCVLASSSSTVESVAPEMVDEVADSAGSSEEAGKMNALAYTVELPSFDAEATISDCKAISDEGWEIFNL